jgi:hypothetical protein
MKETGGTAEHYEAPQHIVSNGRYLSLVPPELDGVLTTGLGCAIERMQEREIKI